MGHVKKKYDITKYNFDKHVKGCYNIGDLTKLHLLDLDLCNSEILTQDNEAETFFHKRFYQKLNDGWSELTNAFHSFVENEVSPLFDGDFLYQQFPSYRVQVPNQIAVSNWHYDNDEDHNHPEWEINFQIAITDMFDTNCMWIESVPGLGDFQPVELEYGEFAIFNGNRCRHGNKQNNTEFTRVSFDFRVLPYNRFDPDNIKYSYYRKPFADGGYYRLFSKGKTNV
tara:strand:+ start:166 stop:843 length:678 start_codon:yes stop_codon:yes gene_type:complete